MQRCTLTPEGCDPRGFRGFRDHRDALTPKTRSAARFSGFGKKYEPLTSFWALRRRGDLEIRGSPSGRTSVVLKCIVAFGSFIRIERAYADGCDHTNTNAPDPIRTPQLSVFGRE